MLFRRMCPENVLRLEAGHKSDLTDLFRSPNFPLFRRRKARCKSIYSEILCQMALKFQKFHKNRRILDSLAQVLLKSRRGEKILSL